MATIFRLGEVPEKTIFMVMSIEKKDSAKYKTYILNFVDALDECYQVLHIFLEQIEKNRGKNQRPYFVSHRMTKRGENTVASFEIAYKKENKSFDVFK